MLQLELRLNPTTGELRFYDPSARRILPSYQEQQVELERLKAELARLNAGQA